MEAIYHNFQPGEISRSEFIIWIPYVDVPGERGHLALKRKLLPKLSRLILLWAFISLEKPDQV